MYWLLLGRGGGELVLGGGGWGPCLGLAGLWVVGGVMFGGGGGAGLGFCGQVTVVCDGGSVGGRGRKGGRGMWVGLGGGE